ncbi:MAG: acylneuraminate cytidylyltransferase family protein [Halopseudomonas sabulinigri]
MIGNKTFLAIVPARGGSKRLPRKNVLPLAGKPLINWSIEAGLNSQYVDTVLVSSDDDEVLATAMQAGAQTIHRPIELAQDSSTSFDAIKHAIDNTKRHDYIILLQPTSPLRTSQHVDEAIQLLEIKNADAVISVTNMEHSPLWANTLPVGDSMEGFLSDTVVDLRSQELDSHYRLNGAIYICKTDKLLSAGSFFLKRNIYAYIMLNDSSVDIDTELDFNWAEFLLGKCFYSGPTHS